MLVKHGKEPGFELGGVAGAGVLVVQHVFFREENAKHGARLVAHEGHAGFVRSGFPSFENCSRFLFKNLVEVRDCHHLLQGLDAGGDGQGIAGEGAGLVDGAIGSDAVHDFLLAAVSSCRKAAADDLAEAGHIRADVISSLGAVE